MAKRPRGIHRLLESRHLTAKAKTKTSVPSFHGECHHHLLAPGGQIAGSPAGDFTR
jgi:hypothetical protein